MPNATPPPVQNHLLGQLPAAEQQRWFPQLELLICHSGKSSTSLVPL